LTIWLPVIMDAGVNLLLTLLNGLTSRMGDIVTTVVTMVVAFVNELTLHLPEIMTAGVNLLLAFLQGIIDHLPDVIAKAAEVIVAFINGIANNLQSIIDSAVNLIVKFLEGIANSIQTIIDAGMDVVDAVVAGVLQAQDRLFNAAIDLVNGFAENIREHSGEVKEAGLNLLSALLEALPGSGLVSRAAEMASGFASEIKRGLNGAIGWANGLIGKINEVPGVNIPLIPSFANGTNNFSGGLARINEGGRGELVNLPNGSQVIPHDVSMKYAKEAARSAIGEPDAGSTVNYEGDVYLTIDRFENNTDRDLETLAYNLAWMTKKERGRLSAY